MRLAELSLLDLLPRLRVAENSPGGYFALLHVWTEAAGSTTEWVARLPSALAGIALVPAVWWLGREVDTDRVGLVAALLTLVSPLVLQYAQQARAYSLAMLALTVAGVAALKTARLGSVRWAIAGAVACSIALSLHYAALAVVLPLCAWMWLRPQLDRRLRLAFCAPPAVVLLAWLPLAMLQRDHHPGSQLGPFGDFTRGHLVRVIGAPFDDRYTADVGFLKAVAALVVLAAIAMAFRYVRRPAIQLMLASALLPMLALPVAALLSIEILNSRYMTFAVPFLLVVIAVAITRTRLPVAAVMLAVLLVVGVVYTARSHRVEGYYPDTRGVIEAIASDWHPGDVVIAETGLVTFPLNYYAEARLPQGTSVVPPDSKAAQRLLKEGARAWIVRQDPPAPVVPTKLPATHRPVRELRFDSGVDLTLTLVAPGRSAH